MGSRSAKILRMTLIIILFSRLSYADEGLKKHLRVLSGEIGKRNAVYYDNLERAAKYIKSEFKSYGYEPVEQVYSTEVKGAGKKDFRNIIAVKDGKGKKSEVIIVCAHYDAFRDSPGADDDGSGVAAVLELARRLRNKDLDKTVKFIAFTNEELETVFDDPDMGSYRYAKEARRSGENIFVVLCLDMLGFYSDVEGSQKRPFPLNFLYPDKGNFVGICADPVSGGLLLDVVSVFKNMPDIPVQYLIAPVPFVPQIMTSDNRSFWTFGYRSVWISDTCVYRNPYMHTAADSYGTLDYHKMDRVMVAIYNVILKLGK